MRHATRGIESRLTAARAGCKESLGATLEACRLYLLWVARRELDPGLRAKVGASDLVQDTLLEVYRDFQRFAGESEAELLAWLRRLLRNNILNAARTYRGTAKRDLGREQSLEALCGEGGDRGFVGRDADPAQEVARGEEAGLLREAVAQLPPELGEVLHLWNEGRSFEEVARLTGRPASTVRTRWLRAVQHLQRTL